MSFTKDGIVRFVYTVITSLIIYGVVTLLLEPSVISTKNILISIGIGCLVWLTAEILFDLVGKLWPYKVLPGYIVLVIIIAVGTIVGPYLLGVKNIVSLLVICSLGEIAGITITIIYYRYYQKKLMDKLNEAKRQ